MNPLEQPPTRERERWERSFPRPGPTPVPLYRSTITRCAGRLRTRLSPDPAGAPGDERCDRCGARFDRGAYSGGHGEVIAMSGLSGYALESCPCPLDHAEVE